MHFDAAATAKALTKRTVGYEFLLVGDLGVCVRPQKECRWYLTYVQGITLKSSMNRG